MFKCEHCEPRRTLLECSFDSFENAIDHIVDIHPLRAKRYIVKVAYNVYESEHPADALRQALAIDS